MIVNISVADGHRDPDPTFYFDADPDPDPDSNPDSTTSFIHTGFFNFIHRSASFIVLSSRQRHMCHKLSIFWTEFFNFFGKKYLNFCFALG
jgi:hypothetical protein